MHGTWRWESGHFWDLTLKEDVNYVGIPGPETAAAAWLAVYVINNGGTTAVIQAVLASRAFLNRDVPGQRESR